MTYNDKPLPSMRVFPLLLVVVVVVVVAVVVVVVVVVVAVGLVWVVAGGV